MEEGSEIDPETVQKEIKEKNREIEEASKELLDIAETEEE